MIIGIYSGKPKVEEVRKDYYLALRIVDADLQQNTVLCVVDEFGVAQKNGDLLAFNNRTGVIARRRDVNPRFGFPLDSENRLRITP